MEVKKFIRVRILDKSKDDLIEENVFPRISLSFLVKLISARFNDESRIIIDFNH